MTKVNSTSPADDIAAAKSSPTVATSTGANRAPAPDEATVGGLAEQLHYWFTTQAPSWAASAVVHMVLFLIAVLVLGTISNNIPNSDAPKFEAALNEIEPATEFVRVELGPPDEAQLPIDPNLQPPPVFDSPPATIVDNASVNFGSASGDSSAMTGDDPGRAGTILAFGPGLKFSGEIGIAENPGPGAPGPYTVRNPTGTGIGTRGTKATERAVAAALNWLARHQNADGSWSIEHNTAKCKDPSCKYTNGDQADAGATAMALLPFFAAGQTHQTKGMYQRTIRMGVHWLIDKQKASGDLSTGPARQMYEHGLATIALCECYGMSGDQRVGYAAQAALNFVASGQNGKGGWRYQHGTPDTDTSVVGWQVMALKSGQMAGLTVNPAVLEKAKVGLLESASGEYRGKFAYQPGKGANPPMTAVGLLCMQYLDTPRGDAGMREGIEYLMKAMPADVNNVSARDADIYYWYYATQVMHNVPGADWEKWNRNMRRILVNSQVRGNICAEGSWDPGKDSWGRRAGGRVMTTALSALTLEVYYRYLPLYKLDRDEKTDDLVKPKVM